MTSAPVISVLLPAWNAAAFLGQAVQSILRQTFANFELLILDDGSTDITWTAALGYTDPRVRVLRNERNLGLTATLNRGLREACGEFIARQDADDTSHPNRFAEQIAFLRAHPRVVLLGTGGEQVSETGRSLGRLRVPGDPLAIRWAMPWDNPFLHTSVMFRREVVLKQFGGYDGAYRISQDYALWQRIAEVHPTANLPESLVTLQVHGASLMRSRGGELDAETARIRAAALQALAPGRKWSPREQALMAGFRSKIAPEHLPEFWRLWQEICELFAGKHPAAAGSREVCAVQAAGIARVGYNLLPEARWAAIQVIARAVRLSPGVAWELPWPRIAALVLLGPFARRLHGWLGGA